MWGFSGSLWLLSCNPLSVLNQENPLSKSSSESYRENIPILIFPPETRGSERGSARRGSSRGPARCRPPPSQGGSWPGAVPGSAGAAGWLRPEDPAKEPAESGPGSLARRAQPLAHGPGVSAARRALCALPRGPFIAAGPSSPLPGAERAGEAAQLGFTPRLDPGQSVRSAGGRRVPRLRSSWRPQRSLSSGCHWTFSGLRPRGRYGRPWVCYSP